MTTKTEPITEKQLNILRHMLGLNGQRARREPDCYRNYYAAEIGCEELCELAALGLVALGKTDDHYEWYYCTDSGKREAIKSFYARRHKKPRRVYHAFLSCSDYNQELTLHARHGGRA